MAIQITIPLFLIILFLPFSSFAAEDDIIKDIFPTAHEQRVGRHILHNQEFKVITMLAKDKIIGWVVIGDEMAKIKPITLLSGIDIQGKVLAVYVLEYRDMFGSEIKRRSFLRQFHNKSLKDTLMIGRDIDAVTGATISSHAATSFVRKCLELIEMLR